MSNILPFDSPSPLVEVDAPNRGAIRRSSRFLALAFSIGLVLTIAFTVALSGAIVFYDGPHLSFGPGGVWMGRPPDAAVGLVALTSFSFVQRLSGAGAIVVLTIPTIFVLFHLRSLFLLYAGGGAFSPASVKHIQRIGAGLVLYALAPWLAHRLIVLEGVFNDPVWFHFDELGALLFSALLFVVAKVMALAREIEQDRDGFI